MTPPYGVVLYDRAGENDHSNGHATVNDAFKVLDAWEEGLSSGYTHKLLVYDEDDHEGGYLSRDDGELEQRFLQLGGIGARVMTEDGRCGRLHSINFTDESIAVCLERSADSMTSFESFHVWEVFPL
jgi:hypothetical protein